MGPRGGWRLTDVEVVQRFDAWQMRLFDAPLDGAPLTIVQFGGEQRFQIAQVPPALAFGGGFASIEARLSRLVTE